MVQLLAANDFVHFWSLTFLYPLRKKILTKSVTPLNITFIHRPTNALARFVVFQYTYRSKMDRRRMEQKQKLIIHMKIRAFLRPDGP